MKKTILKFMMTVLVALVSINLHAYDIQKDGIYYNLNHETKTAEVTNGDNKYTSNVIIPETIEYESTEYSVISIGESAFKQCKDLTSVDIPNTVQTIGKQAFYSASIITITIPSSIKTIKMEAFIGCGYLERVVIDDLESWCNIDFEISPNGGTNPLEKASHLYVGDNEIVHLVIPSTITTIKAYTFKGCEGIKTVEMPDAVISIGREAFDECTNLESVKLPSSLQSIGYAAFSWCTSLKTIVIPNSVTIIDKYAFAQCHNLVSVKLPALLAHLQYGCFVGCYNLKSIDIPNSVWKINQHVFQDCSSLSTVYLGSNLNQIMDEAFRNCDNLTEVYCKSITPPQMSYPHFNYSAKLYVKKDCIDAYKSHKAWGQFNSIKEYPITNLRIDESVKEVNEEYMANIHGIITSVTIPNNVMKITSFAFRNCESLECVTIESGTETLDFDAGDNFYGCPINSVYIGRKMVYQTNTPFKNNKEGLSTLTIGPNVTEIQENAFIGHNGITTLSLSEGLKKIGKMAFYGCDGLTSLVIPCSVEEVGNQAFDLCRGLIDLRIEDGTKPLTFSVDNENTLCNTFINSPLQNVYVGRNIEYMGLMSPLSLIESISKLTLGNKVTNIQSQTYTGLSKTIDVVSYAEIVPVIEEIVFTESYLDNSTLHIPVVSCDDYMKKSPWDKFGKIFVIMGDGTEKEAFSITYMIDELVYKKKYEPFGNNLTALEVPEKEGYTFSGWDNLPATMPEENITVTGSYVANKYALTYVVDGETYKVYEVGYGSDITAENAPTKEGYTFNGWDEVPATMPANDVTVTGSFTINKYTLTYKVDGETYKTHEVEYGSDITAENAPTKEGYTFSGWDEVPATMPANDVTVTGSFTINKYTLTYKVDGETYKTYEVEYGADITAEKAPTKDGYTFSGWSEIPATMPAEDVTITGFFTFVDAITDVDANSVPSIKKVFRKGKVIIIRDGKEYDTNGKPAQ